MSFLDSLRRYAEDYRARRRRMRSYLEIASLPREIQKDIGWQPDDQSWRAARHHTDAR